MKDDRFNVVENEKGCMLVEPISITPTKSGHIKLRMNGVPTYLHRFVYEEEFGKIADGLIVRHKCDNPNCINVEHLELGVHSDNVYDRVERGRSAKGENNGRAKLTEDDVRYIRSCNITNKSQLARMFNVDRKTISNILKYKLWKDI